ncbi:c-type cytochrome [Haemophilus parahaemolyticus]|uniref:c-type cytochrome n=1 Tax=Haemophilus parahaemolyticus TaxID=735 RepID=UPI002492AF92|nr:c-type cytochrome [Haemophilus parahaemolyticus]
MLAILLGNLSFSAWADMDIIPAGKLYRRSCATCHGKTAEKSAIGKSKVVNQLNSAEIAEALIERKNGKVNGGGNTAKRRLSDKEIKVLSEYLPSLKR